MKFKPFSVIINKEDGYTYRIINSQSPSNVLNHATGEVCYLLQCCFHHEERVEVWDIDAAEAVCIPFYGPMDYLESIGGKLDLIPPDTTPTDPSVA